MEFELISEYQPTGDQPQAIQQLVDETISGTKSQTLLGVTGSGKTFTMANVIARVNKPTLILSHNKTLAAQLYGEFKRFFPNNAVEYFISYYDYYQPEAYVPSTDLYIEKDFAINDEIEKLRLSASSALITGRRDVIVIASVSCIYGNGNPDEFHKNSIEINKNDKISRNQFLHKLVSALYTRTTTEFSRGNFRVKGDTIDVYLAYADFAYRIIFWDDEVEAIQKIDPISGKKINNEESVRIFPANLFVIGQNILQTAIHDIQEDLVHQIAFFKKEGMHLEAKRIKERVEYDLEMMRELGFCPGMENYSRYFDKRLPGTRPFCLLDYFPKDFLMVIDESHVTLPQIRAMWKGDRARKSNLVNYGFRLPAAIDNRPLTFNEFEKIVNQIIYVSATPSDYEIERSDGIIIEQIIRPTGLLDPVIEVRPILNQIDDLIDEVSERVENKEKILITTLTKRMAEELSKYLLDMDVKCRYIHSEIKALDRVEILRELRIGVFDVLVGVNLLREGLDLPEVSLVVILDADKEGFLRNQRSLIQTIGRAARNENGKVIMYADQITKSMHAAIDETNRRRKLQMDYNKKHNITPQTIKKSTDAILEQTTVADNKANKPVKYYVEQENTSIAADPVVKYMNKQQVENAITQTQKAMENASKKLDFLEAARLRDELFEYKRILKEKLT